VLAASEGVSPKRMSRRAIACHNVAAFHLPIDLLLALPFSWHTFLANVDASLRQSDLGGRFKNSFWNDGPFDGKRHKSA
jgi:hypothetical protein